MKRKLWTWKDISQLQKFYPEKKNQVEKKILKMERKKFLPLTKKKFWKEIKVWKEKIIEDKILNLKRKFTTWNKNSHFGKKICSLRRKC